jgi:hypothetical protein
MKHIYYLGLVLALLFSAVQAQAVSFTFSFDNSDHSIYGSGTLEAVDNLNGTFTAVSGSGTFTVPDLTIGTNSVTLIANPSAPTASLSASGAFIYDDLLYPTSTPVIDSNGLLFGYSIGSTVHEVNIWNDGGGALYTYYDFNGSGYVVTAAQSINFDLSRSSSATPEPSTLFLLGSGLIGFAGYGRRRFLKR